MTMNEAVPDLVPVEDVAKELGTTALNVIMHIKRRLLMGREVEGKWYVTAESLMDYRLKGRAGAAASLCARPCSSKSGCGSCA